MPTATPSEQYTGQLTLTASATVNAIAVASGFANSAVATANYTVQSGSSGLVAWWKFDEGSGTTAADSSGNGNTMNLVNGVSWVAGKIGGAISANGTNQYATEPAINLSATSTVTVAFWANRTYSTTVESVMLESSTNYNNSTTGFGFFPDDTQCQGIQAAVHGNVGYSVNCYAQPIFWGLAPLGRSSSTRRKRATLRQLSISTACCKLPHPTSTRLRTPTASAITRSICSLGPAASFSMLARWTTCGSTIGPFRLLRSSSSTRGPAARHWSRLP